jgi:hypothetical protein
MGRQADRDLETDLEVDEVEIQSSEPDPEA